MAMLRAHKGLELCVGELTDQLDSPVVCKIGRYLRRSSGYEHRDRGIDVFVGRRDPLPQSIDHVFVGREDYWTENDGIAWRAGDPNRSARIQVRDYPIPHAGEYVSYAFGHGS